MLAALLITTGCHDDPEARTAAAPQPPPAQATTPEAPDALEQDQLRALGYLAWRETSDADRGRSGVVHHDPARSRPGFNLWNSLPRRRAVLMDNRGDVHHSWQAETGGTWGHIELLADGSLLILQERPFELIRIARDSTILWRTPMQAHHDVDVAPDGSYWVLDSRPVFVAYRGEKLPIVNDLLVNISPQGERLREVSLFQILRPHIDLDRVLARSREIDASRGHLDVMHVNTLSIIREDRGPLLRAGRILFAARNLDLIGILDPASGKLEWGWGRGTLDWPHQPTLLDSGNIVVFDNGTHRGFSRLLEIEPESRQVVWRHQGEPRAAFFAEYMGGVQELGNGHLLVTDSPRGRVFELTRDQEVVWDFLNPDVLEEGGERAAIYRMVRFDEDALPPGLLEPKQ